MQYRRLIASLGLILLAPWLGASSAVAEDLYKLYRQQIEQAPPPKPAAGEPASTPGGAWGELVREVERIRAMEKGTFEKTAAFEKRRQAAIDALEARVETAATNGSTAYQAGTATMTGYNADREVLSLAIQWKADAQGAIQGLEAAEGSISIAPGEAAQAFGSQKSHPLFVTVAWTDRGLRANRVLLGAGGKAFPVRRPVGDLRVGDRFGGGELPEMTVIPAGSVALGGRSFAIPKMAMGVYEVTFAQYDRFAQASGNPKPNDQGWGRGDRPVINVNWTEARDYARWAGGQLGLACRLPTEAEWEYAARAGTTTKYWWGDDIGRNNANCDGCGSQWDNQKTAPVGSFAANQFGLYDTAGNVWEWTCSEYNSSVDQRANQCKQEPGQYQSLRGGAWNNNPDNLAAGNRNRNTPDNRNNNNGFRVACSLPPER